MSSMISAAVKEIKKIICDVSFEVSCEWSEQGRAECLSLLVCSLADIGTYSSCSCNTICDALDKIIPQGG
jgi:hypothetical protein